MGTPFLSLLLTDLWGFNFPSQGGVSTPSPFRHLSPTEEDKSIPDRLPRQAARDGKRRTSLLSLCKHPRSRRHTSLGALECPPGDLAPPGNCPAWQCRAHLRTPALRPGGCEDDPLYSARCLKNMGSRHTPYRAWLEAGRTLCSSWCVSPQSLS